MSDWERKKAKHGGNFYRQIKTTFTIVLLFCRNMYIMYIVHVYSIINFLGVDEQNLSPDFRHGFSKLLLL